EQPGPGRAHSRRHGEPGQHEQRQEEEQDSEIGALLEDVVVQRRRAGGEAKPRMVLDVLPEMARRKLLPLWREVALDVPVPEAPQPVEEAGDDEQPGEEEVPGARAGEVVAGRDRRPAGKGAVAEIAVPVPPVAEQAGG